ncbi:MAG: nucleotide exchange factor GrpE, partial [bacterium]|nr:nucleotide exchange factor GrpE [bacterium]
MSAAPREGAGPGSPAEEKEAAAAAAPPGEAEEAPPPEPDYHDLYIRLQADFQNFRKRQHRERADTEARIVQGILAEILPIADDLERALESAGENEQALIEGLRLTLKRMQDALQRAGVEPVPGKGAPFDPNVHEAVSVTEDPGVPPNCVVEVLQ